MENFKNLVIIPNEGILFVNGEHKEIISKFYLQFDDGRWVLTCEWGEARKVTAGNISVAHYMNLPVAKVSFEIYESDWYILQQSETWKRIQSFLAVSGRQGDQMCLQDKINLLENPVMEMYRSATGELHKNIIY